MRHRICAASSIQAQVLACDAGVDFCGPAGLTIGAIATPCAGSSLTPRRAALDREFNCYTGLGLEGIIRMNL